MSKIAKRYAVALLEISEQEGKTDRYKLQIRDVIKFVKENKEVRHIFKDPRIHLDIKKNLMLTFFKNDMEDKIINFLMLLVDKGRIMDLEDICKEYEMLADKKKKTLRVKVFSSYKLDEKEIKKIEDKYKVMFGVLSVNIQNEISEDIIGGIKVQIGDRVIDDTIKGRLDSLRKIFT